MRNGNRLAALGLVLAAAASLGFERRTTAEEKPSDRASRVPKFTFPTTLAAEEEALRTNPLMRRFAHSRQRLAADRYRPLYHFVCPESNLNDPNGLCFWQGRWHMFYQAYPPEDPRQHWGHAVSDDLIHWRDLPYAIYPDPERCCFSGSTLVEENRVIAMYHGTEAGNMVAVATDPLLLNWEKLTGQPVIPMKSRTGFPLPYNIFDPCIWKSGGIYYALSGGRTMTGPGGRGLPTVYLFRSKDLVNWEYCHEFVEGDRFSAVGNDYAVPYFWPIGTRYLFTFASHMSGGHYLLGDYDTARKKFVVSGYGDFNFGSYGFPAEAGGVNAPSTTPDGKGGVIVIFNLMNNKPLGPWGQIMSLPRRLTLLGNDVLGQEPAGDIASLRGQRTVLRPLELPANKEIVLDAIHGDTLEVNLELDVKNAAMIELCVLRSPQREEFTRIAFFKEGGFYAERQGVAYPVRDGKAPPPVIPFRTRTSMLLMDSTRSSLDGDVRYRPPATAPLLLLPEEVLRLHVFIDKSVVEVFANGVQVMTERVFPSRDDSRGISLRAQGSPAELKSLEAWPMRSIYP
jgi:beta-fructofuranosidase